MNKSTKIIIGILISALIIVVGILGIFHTTKISREDKTGIRAVNSSQKVEELLG